MRKTIALVLVAAMMLMFVPMAFAASYTLTAVKNTASYYYCWDDDPELFEQTTNGGIAYISVPYDNGADLFASWQVPGNTLTGSVATWNKWIKVEAVINVQDAVKGTEVLIEGAKYYTDEYGNFTYTFYCLPQAGGNTVSRTLALYTSGNSLMGYVTLSMVYSDVYKPTGTVSTEGINQANTYATIDSDGVITVDVVYSNLVARMASTSSTNVGYPTVSYYPIRVRTVLTDKDGNLFPAFTRVDVDYVSESDVVVSIEEVPNMTNWFYLTEDSDLLIEKRLGAKGTKLTTLEIYLEKARLYGGFNTDGTLTKDYLSEVATWGGAQRLTGYGGLSNIVITGQAFNKIQFNSWTTDHVTATSNNNQEDAIRGTIDFAITEYFTDPANTDVFGKYAFALENPIYAAGSWPDYTHDAVDANDAVVEYGYLAMRLQKIYWDATGTNLFVSDAGIAVPANDATVRAIPDTVPASTPAVTGKINLGALTGDAFKAAVESAYSVFSTDYAKIGTLGAGYELSKLNLLLDLLGTGQNFRVGRTPVTGIEVAVNNAKAAYRADIATALQNQLQSNANLYNNTIDKMNLTLTKPNGEVSKIYVQVKYNSVSRIVAKALTTLDATQKTVTIVKGESVDVTVKAYQDQVPVTGQPIKFTSNDTNIATATSPNVQSTSNSNTTTITGVNVGTTTVRAYVQSSAYSSSSMTTKVEAETYITVNVVDPVAETPVETAPETTDFVCKVRKLWIRDGAGTSNSKLGYFSRNDIAKVIEVVNGWAKIEFNGGIAYASTGDGKYLSPK